MTLPSGYRRIDLPFDRRFEMISVDEWAFAMTRPTEVREQVATGTDWSRARGVETEARRRLSTRHSLPSMPPTATRCACPGALSPHLVLPGWAFTPPTVVAGFSIR